ncbi:MAG: Nif3-like dinuclear metal center hexameric protein [Clostridia bacterium]|nr:Nif3-like dinuclear metal center hexameric protein [Clostridia bacterium]
MKIRDVYDMIDRLAPFDTQADFDNSGLLAGRRDQEVTGIHFALDVTQRVLDEAEAEGANLIIAHHPLMFRARKNLTEDDYEGALLCRMIRSRIGLIAAHTNFDAAPGGTNETLAVLCGLTGVTGESWWRVGDLPDGMTAGRLTAFLESTLRTSVRVYGQFPQDHPLRRLGICTGAGSEYWQDAAALGADAFLTGEMKHHDALAMADAGVIGLEAGHFATEEPGIFALADALQKAADAVQWKVRITRSRCGGYALPRAHEGGYPTDGSYGNALVLHEGGHEG